MVILKFLCREVPCSALKGETVPDSLPATPKSPPTRRVDNGAARGQFRFQGLRKERTELTLGYTYIHFKLQPKASWGLISASKWHSAAKGRQGMEKEGCLDFKNWQWRK